jgi:hypothetical protein
MPACQRCSSGTIRIALDDHSLGVVEQYLPRHAAEELERSDQPIAPVLELLGASKANEGRAGKAQRRYEREQSIATATNDGEVRLHPQAWLGLEAHHGIGSNNLERPHVRFELADAADVSFSSNLTQQHRRRNPIRSRLLDALEQLGLEGIELARPRCARPVTYIPGLSQVLAHRVPR